MAKKVSLKHLLWLLPVLALVGFTGFRVYQTMMSKAEPAAAGGGGAGRGGPGGAGRATQVQTDRVSTGKINEKIALTGTLKPKQQVDVNPQMAGRITQILVDTGQPVARGALLAVIEDDQIKQQVERAGAAISVDEASITQREAELSNARAELERKRKLVEEGLLSRIELDTLETRVRVTQSQLELARAQRRQSQADQRELNIRQGQTRIYSPIAGVVARRQVDIGAMGSSNSPIVTVVSISPMIIEAQVPERDIARIRRGSTVKVTVDSLPDQNFTGRVMRIAPLLDPQTRNGLVEIEIPNRNSMLKGEMFARIELDLGSSRETTLLPRDALVYRGEQPGVYTIENDAAKFLAVETGLTQEDKVEVLSGLKAGDTVITGGANLLKDGDRVRVAGRPGGEGGGQRRGQGQPEGQAQPEAGNQPQPAATVGAEQRPDRPRQRQGQ